MIRVQSRTRMYQSQKSGVRMKYSKLEHVVPDVCCGHIWDDDQGAEVDATTQLLFTSCPSEKVCLEIFWSMCTHQHVSPNLKAITIRIFLLHATIWHVGREPCKSSS